MSEFNFKSAVCTSRSQSERLLALGLKPETADLLYLSIYSSSPCHPEQTTFELDDEGVVPAWSLHRLIEMMPKCVLAHSSGDDSPRLHPYVPKFDYLGVTIENIDEILDEFYQHTDLYDNLIDCIEWLIDDNRFNKEYLV